MIKNGCWRKEGQVGSGGTQTQQEEMRSGKKKGAELEEEEWREEGVAAR